MSTRKNEWSLITFDDIAEYIERQEIAQIRFSQDLGITNSTFHNWKSGKSIPDDAMQAKIAKMIGVTAGGRKRSGSPRPKADGRKRKASPKKASAGTDQKPRAAPKKRGRPKKSETAPSGSQSLDDLLSSPPRRGAKKSTAQKKSTAALASAASAPKGDTTQASPLPASPLKAQPAHKNGVAKSSAGRVKVPASLAGAPDQNLMEMSERAFLVHSFMERTPVTSIEDYGRLIQTVSSSLS